MEAVSIFPQSNLHPVLGAWRCVVLKWKTEIERERETENKHIQNQEHLLDILQPPRKAILLLQKIRNLREWRKKKDVTPSGGSLSLHQPYTASSSCTTFSLFVSSSPPPSMISNINPSFFPEYMDWNRWFPPCLYLIDQSRSRILLGLFFFFYHLIL